MKKGVALVILVGVGLYILAPRLLRRAAEKSSPVSMKAVVPRLDKSSAPAASPQPPQPLERRKVAQAKASCVPQQPSESKKPVSIQTVVAPERRPQSGSAKAQDRTGRQKLAELLKQADALRRQNKKYEARNLFSEAYMLAATPPLRDQIRVQLDALNKVLIFSREPSPDAVMYRVRPGDTLSGIAKKYGVTYQLIKRINHKSRDIIVPNERLKILKGKVGILVDKSDFRLVLLLDGHYVKEYPVGIGREGSETPTGTFEVATKLVNPTWYAPDGGVYKFGHPKNVLGTRWIGFRETETHAGYGIHGTTEPNTIPGRASDGCIRMLNRDVEEVYDFVPPGTPVVIRE